MSLPNVSDGTARGGLQSESLQPTELQPRSENSSCPEGCDEGWHWNVPENSARPCSCLKRRRRANPEFQGDYRPGGLTGRASRRAIARRAGIASGVKRRQLSRGRRPQRRDRGEALALSYRIRQATSGEFERLYQRMCERESLPFDRRGLNTAYALYRLDVASYRAQGQDHETTNRQRGIALSSHGRPRCRRTIQLTRKRLEAMGLVRYHHVRRSGAQRTPGQLDSLRVQLMPLPRLRRLANCTPPTGTTTPPPGRVVVCPEDLPAEPENSLIAPAPPADDQLPPAAAVTQDEQSDASRSALPHQGQEGPEEANCTPLEASSLEEEHRLGCEFDELKRQMGWTVPQRHRIPDWGGHA